MRCRESLFWCSLLPAAAVSAQPPADCAGEKAALVLFAAPPGGESFEATLYPGQETELRLTALLEVDDVCVNSFSIAVAHPRPWMEIVDVTDDGTDSESYLAGFRITEVTRARDGFVAAALAGDPCPPLEAGGEGGGGSIGAFPRRGSLSLVFARYRILPQPAPPGGAAVLEGAIEFRDGLTGSGQPIVNSLYGDGVAKEACRQALSVRVTIVDTVDFFRGDANFDGVLDISDPVTVLRASFLGDTRIECDDAGDANDDGALDISDAVSVFGYLFLGSVPLPPPFPVPGKDPTDDALRCRP